MARMLRENRPLKFFTVPSNRIHEFAREAKKSSLPYVVIRDRKNTKQCELLVFADDEAKVNRVMDQMQLDYLKSENGEAVQEAVREPEGTHLPGNPQEAERTPQPEQASPARTETVEMPEGDIQFELSDFEEDFNVGDLPEVKEPDMENFIHAREGRNPSGPSSRSSGISSGPGEANKKPSVREELNQIKQEKQEAGKKRQRDKSRGNRQSKKKMKDKGR